MIKPITIAIYCSIVDIETILVQKSNYKIAIEFCAKVFTIKKNVSCPEFGI